MSLTKFSILISIFFLGISLFLTFPKYAFAMDFCAHTPINEDPYETCRDLGNGLFERCHVAWDDVIGEMCYWNCRTPWDDKGAGCNAQNWACGNYKENVCTHTLIFEGCLKTCGQCGVPSSPPDCPSACHSDTQYPSNECGTNTCYSNAPSAGTIPACRTSGGSVSNGNCGTTSYSANCNTSCSGNTCVAAPTATVVPTATGTPVPTATPTPTGTVKKPCWICDAGGWRKAGGALNLTYTESECLNTEKGVWQDTQPTASCLTNCPDNKICYKCNAGQFTQNGQQSDCNSGSPACSSAITTGVCCSAGLPSGTCGGPTPTPTGTVTPTGTISPSPTPTPVIHTTEYRCSDVEFSKNDTGSSSPPWQDYKNPDFSGEPIKFSYTFTNNVVIGNDLTLFCQFKTDTGTTSQVYRNHIKYIGGDPKITSASCSYDPTGTGTQVTIRGINLGNHDQQGQGKIILADKDATVSYWAKDVEASGSAEATSSSQLNYKVVAKIKDKLPDGKYPIALTNDDGRTADGYCSIGTTTIDFTLKTTCGAIFQDLSQDNVSADVTEKVDKAKPLVKKKIKIDKEGKSEDFAPSVEIGKDYVLTLKGPKSVSRKTEFTAEEGTTNLGDIILSVGDIYPVSVPDNKINAFDKSEMGREWSLVTDVERPADLNNDKRVNSVDYSCFLNNYNRSGD